ncbi:MaoC family dehydratase [Nocardia asteroides]|uniref:MaoC family dehydratase n=1 Tax=Nocardia asteroides TaxID=1824 RepID=UPI0037C79BED
MKRFSSLQELALAVGTHLGYSEWHPVTQEQIDLFARATGDRQWIHVDPARAAQGPFGGTIAHGYLTLSLLPMLTSEIYTVGGLTMGINYGADKLRFPAPVPSGSTVRAGAELVSVTQSSSGYRVTTRVAIECEGSAKPACVVDMVSLLVP